jgi:F0F1-type ATP synthase delta subunit
MPSRASAARYARALFDVALKESDPVQIERELAAFAALMSSNAELHARSPIRRARQRQAPIAEALGTRLNARRRAEASRVARRSRSPRNRAGPARRLS